ncbi:DUF998 domain-containing protein [Nonomuraea sp. NPDC046570]|uniref:DUF998 domain-containing protein n=1 Tax=Nonomuraea sp. NPDC046570 TaxID=3155255 RepID=UPI0033D80924
MHQPARAGLVAVGAGIVMILGLDVAYLGEVNPLRRTISEHGLGEQGWVFGLGVALLAAGSLAIAVSLVRRRLAGVVGTIALLGWSLGLLVTAYFPKHDWSVGPSLSGSIHRVGSLVAFLCLPLAALLIGRIRHRPTALPAPRIGTQKGGTQKGSGWGDGGRGRVAAMAAFLLGAGSLLWVAGIAAVVTVAEREGLAWWQMMPLGLVERGLAVTEVAALIALGIWASQRPSQPASIPLDSPAR